MFNLLKEKLKSWTKNISESISSSAEVKKSGREDKKPKKKGNKEIKIPEKFNPGTQKYELDFEKLKEIEEDIASGSGKLEDEEKLSEKKIVKPILSQEEEKKSFFQSIKEKISNIQKVKISQDEFDVYSEELEMLLLENNVALEVTEGIIKKLRERILNTEFLKREVEEQIKDTLKDIIEDTLVEPFDIIENIKKKKNTSSGSGKPYVILFCGINGSGKTTSVAKVADFLKEKDISCVLAAADTFRAASIEQLKKHGDKIRVKVISHEYGSDPASVGFDAIKYAEKNLIDCVLIDTAGRMHTSKDLLREMGKISRVCKPDLKIFVGESITGNDAVEQAKSFNEVIGIDGIILTKSDIDEKGGTALSVGYVTKKPILYLGTGQEYEAIEVFNKKKFVERLGL